MHDADLFHAHTELEGLGKDLRVNHRADGADLDMLKDRTAEKLEGAIDIPNGDAEGEPDEEVPSCGVERAVKRVAPALAVAGDYVVIRCKLEEAGDIGKIELAIGVGKENPFVARGHDATLERGAITPVATMVDGANLGNLVDQGIANTAGRIVAAIVDDDNLPLRGDCGQNTAGGLDGIAEVVLLVESWENDRKGPESGQIRRDAKLLWLPVYGLGKQFI